MPELIEQKVLIGQDAYGRTVTMTRRKNYDGKIMWALRTEPSSQLDDGERFDGLTDENVRHMVEALKYVRT